MPGPLDGFTVIEACQMIAGPLAGSQLADLGAEVIKIENPVVGDRMRYLGSRVKDISAVFAGTNRGKRSVVFDLQQPEGVDLLKQLVASADVFIQNFRPGVTERLGIDEPALRAVNERLIYVSVSGFGETGPYVDQKSYDYVIQALSGMAALQTDGTGSPSLIRNFVIDKTTAGYATQAVLAALLARERGAGGQHIQLSMLDVALAFLWPDGMMQHTFLDSDRVSHAPHVADGYLVRATKDGHLALMATSERQFPALCRALQTTWMDDPRFATFTARNDNADALSTEMSAAIAGWDSAALAAALHAQDVPCAVVNPIAAVHLDPQVVHNASVIEHERPWLGRVREPLPPVSYSATPAGFGRHAPRHDEHTDEVLTELGLTPDTIADLRNRAVVGSRRS